MRDAAVVEEFVLELLEKYREETPASLTEKIQKKQVLDKEEKKALSDYLAFDAKQIMEKAIRSRFPSSSILAEIDTLGIYADAWGQYIIA